KNYSEKVAESIDDEIRRIIEQGYRTAEKILQEHMDKLHRIAQELIQNETVEGDALDRLFTDGTSEPPTATAPPAVAPAPPPASAAARRRVTRTAPRGCRGSIRAPATSG